MARYMLTLAGRPLRELSLEELRWQAIGGLVVLVVLCLVAIGLVYVLKKRGKKWGWRTDLLSVVASLVLLLFPYEWLCPYLRLWHAWVWPAGAWVWPMPVVLVGWKFVYRGWHLAREGERMESSLFFMSYGFTRLYAFQGWLLQYARQLWPTEQCSESFTVECMVSSIYVTYAVVIIGFFLIVSFILFLAAYPHYVKTLLKALWRRERVFESKGVNMLAECVWLVRVVLMLSGFCALIMHQQKLALILQCFGLVLHLLYYRPVTALPPKTGREAV